MRACLLPVAALLALAAGAAEASRPSNCPHDASSVPVEAEPFAWVFEPAPPASAAAIRIDCTDAGCRVERTVVVSNPTAAAHDGLLVGVSDVLVDGALVKEQRLDLLAADDRFRAPIARLCGGVEVTACMTEGKVERAYAVPVHVAAGASVRIALHDAEGLYVDFPRRAHQIPGGCSGSIDPVPIDTRHMLLGRWHDRGPRTGTAIVRERGTADVTVTYPRGWDVHVSGGSAPAPAPDGSERVVVRATMQDSLAIARTLPPASWLRRGGPFVAAGSSGPDQEMKFAMRAGYELATPGWLIYSLAVESDFERVTVVPAIEAALSTTWALHWAAGAGVPVEVVGDPTVGARGQLALHMGPVGMVIAVDYFPSRDATIAGVYGQLSL